MALHLRLILVAVVLQPGSVSAGPTIGFWDQPQRGANSFNASPPDEAYFQALSEYGATWVRLSFERWPSTSPDFLLGNADNYERLNRLDLKTLTATLDRAHAAGLMVVVTPLSLPGARTRQSNENRYDDRIWTDRRYWQQSGAFWRDLSAELKDHPAVAAYNLINEPAPERRGGLGEGAPPDVMQAWYEGQRGTARDLATFYARLIRQIRTVDAHTPIMLDAGFHASPFAYRHFPAPFADPAILYAWHMYEPWAATSAPNMRRDEPYVYPGIAPFGDHHEQWDADRIAAVLRYPVKWAQRQGVPPTRLVAAELGCMRRWESCPRYLDDVLSVVEADGVHWAFYAFREDVWDGMDYELGPGKLPWQYWDAIEAGRHYPLERGPNEVFEPILRRLRMQEP